MNAKIRAYFVAFLCGFVVGAGIVGGFWLYDAGRDAAASRSIISAYQSALADWQRRAAELDGQLTELRNMARQNRELAARLDGVVTANMDAVAKARSEYERGVAQLRLAAAIYDVLRRYYDQGYNPAPKTGESAKH